MKYNYDIVTTMEM